MTTTPPPELEEAQEAASPQPAPGARAARTFGTLAITSAFGAFVCLFFLFSVADWLYLLGFAAGPVLAGIGIWKHIAAKRAVKRAPGLYAKPDSYGFRLSIWGLVFDALFFAVIVPALWADAVAARDHYTVSEAAKAPMASLLEAYPALMRSKSTHQEVLKGLDSILDQTNAQGHNAWDHAHPLVISHIEEVPQQTPEAVEATARAEAKQLGQGVFVLAFPANGRPGYLAAAARLKKSRFATGGANSKVNSTLVELPVIN